LESVGTSVDMGKRLAYAVSGRLAGMADVINLRGTDGSVVKYESVSNWPAAEMVGSKAQPVVCSFITRVPTTHAFEEAASAGD
jgi:hypothetical protein